MREVEEPRPSGRARRRRRACGAGSGSSLLLDATWCTRRSAPGIAVLDVRHVVACWRDRGDIGKTLEERDRRVTQARSPVARVAMTTSMCKQVQEEQGECYAEKADKAMQETANLALHDL